MCADKLQRNESAEANKSKQDDDKSFRSTFKSFLLKYKFLKSFVNICVIAVHFDLSIINYVINGYRYAHKNIS